MITLVWSIGMIVIMVSGVLLGISIERDKWIRSCTISHLEVRGRAFKVREIL